MFGLVPGASTGWNDGFAGFSTFARSVWPTGAVVHDEWHLKHSSYSALGAVVVSDAGRYVYIGRLPAEPFSTFTRLAPSVVCEASLPTGPPSWSARAVCGSWQSSHSACRWLAGVRP